MTPAEQELRQAALDYHRSPIKGKIRVEPTHPLDNQHDLSLAYSPGVAYPCLEIEKDPQTSYDYISRGNLVGVITNGTAVLGLGDIGALAVNGVTNDLAMGGAQSLYLSASFIIEEGFSFAELRKIAENMGESARTAGVMTVTGDTKVVERGKADGVFVTTAGVGMIPDDVNLSGDRARPGDSVILSGSLGDHGVAVMMARQNLGFDTQVESDCAALHELVAAMLATAGSSIRLMRDPTRGGLAATLNEIAQQSQVGVRLREEDIPVKPAVAAVCELLGLDPLNVANEGKLVAVVDAAAAPALLDAMRAHPLGRHAAAIGTVIADRHRYVEMETKFGGRRVVDWLSGEQLPRIC